VSDFVVVHHRDPAERQAERGAEHGRHPGTVGDAGRRGETDAPAAEATEESGVMDDATSSSGGQ